MPITEPGGDDQDFLQDKLQGLTEQFNTNKGFGLMGMVDNNDPQQRTYAEQEQGQSTQQQSADVEDKMPAWVEPFNSSMRALSDNVRSEIGGIKSELGQIRQQQASNFASAQVETLDPDDARYNRIEQELKQQAADNEYQKALNALHNVKQRHPDAEFDETHLRNIWQQNNLSNNIQAARATNWNDYWKNSYDLVRAPKLEQEVKSLREQLASKSSDNPLNNLAGVPRGNRSMPSPAPAQLNSDGTDEDVYQYANKRMGRNLKFDGFHKLIQEGMRAKSLRNAV